MINPLDQLEAIDKKLTPESTKDKPYIAGAKREAIGKIKSYLTVAYPNTWGYLETLHHDFTTEEYDTPGCNFVGVASVLVPMSNARNQDDKIQVYCLIQIYPEGDEGCRVGVRCSSAKSLHKEVASFYQNGVFDESSLHQCYIGSCDTDLELVRLIKEAINVNANRIDKLNNEIDKENEQKEHDFHRKNIAAKIYGEQSQLKLWKFVFSDQEYSDIEYGFSSELDEHGRMVAADGDIVMITGRLERIQPFYATPETAPHTLVEERRLIVRNAVLLDRCHLQYSPLESDEVVFYMDYWNDCVIEGAKEHLGTNFVSCEVPTDLRLTPYETPDKSD